MAPIAKETDVQSSGPRASLNPEQGNGKTQPVALEVSVTVNGARTVEGSDKREPFSETSKTVLIFANGAVIRLASTVAPGQLLFLTNENTKKEVVCQVVKSKNYRSVSGYVELEFTEPAPGFWGMRFPTERAAPAPQAGASASSNVPPAAPKVNPSAPVSPLNSTPAAISPSLPPVNKAQPPAPTAEAARAITTPTKSQIAAPSGGPTTDPETEALKKEAARLQEQLSGLLFSQNAGSRTQPHAPKSEAPAPEMKAKVIEMTPRPEPVTTTPTAKPVSQATPTMQSGVAPPQKATLDLAAEEVKIPAWLEPLARNSATSSPVETPARTELASFEEAVPAEETSEASSALFSSEGPTPTFSGQLFGEDNAEPAAASGKSGKGILIGLVAAGVIAAAAAGTWYFGFRHPAAATAQTAAPMFATLPASSSSNSDANSRPAPTSAQPSSLSGNAAVASSNQRSAETLRTSAAAGPLPVVDARERERIATSREETPARTSPGEITEQPKKPALGDVKLAAPTVSAQQVNADVSAPHIGGEAVATDAGAMSPALIAGNSSQPVAPVPVGGEVKSARLLHSVPPVYPPLARSQRVSGDVRIDALVDPTGHVTTMKIVSGPVLLHQAAKDALHQWRYQPAMLDGKPVPMHLTVTVQFRLQ
jgi:protein TonB